MDVTPFVRIDTLAGKSSFVATSAPSDQFSRALQAVVYRDQTQKVQGNEKASAQGFQRFKEKSELDEIDEVNEEEEDQAATVYKTVKKIEKRLVALARLERQSRLGF